VEKDQANVPLTEGDLSETPLSNEHHAGGTGIFFMDGTVISAKYAVIKHFYADKVQRCAIIAH
jgi:hypothetical protein